jgi:LysM repeat protein
MAANGITNPNLIVPGQKLVIPAPVASPSTPNASPSAAP